METFVLLIIISFAITAIVYGVYSYKKENRRLEEEEEARKREEAWRQEEEAIAKRRAYEERRAEEERKRKIMCCICGKCSMGDLICKNCLDRVEPLEKEIPQAVFKNYLSLCNFRDKTINGILTAKTQAEKEYHCLHLVTATNRLQNKYHIADAWEQTEEFLKELQKQGEQINDEFIAKYAPQAFADVADERQEHQEEAPKETKKQDAETKRFRCKDGHEVRSKAEREIDNFFYENQIWHIYEYKYEHPVTKEWAKPDFYLPDHNLYIEYFGLATKEYLQNREHKIKMYRSDKSIRFDYLTYEDDNTIYDKLTDICRKYNIPVK